MRGQSWITRTMKLALLAAILASALFCGWSGPIDVDNALRPALSHDQLKGIGRLLRVDPAVAVTDWECSTCKILFTELQNLFLKNATDEKIMAHITEYCIRLKIEDKLVCTAIVIEFKDEVLSIFDQVALGPNEVCGILLGPSCGDPYNPWNQTWIVKLPPTPKPPVVPVPPPKPGSPVSKVLYLSDIHFDKNYTAGLNAECGEPLCCRPPNGPPPPGKRAAGPWGDYNCDCPLQTLENLLQHVGNMSSEFDWVYITGDLPPHNVWNQTREDQLYVLEFVTSLIKTYLPGKMIFPAVGNHESAPVNSFPPPFVTGPNSGQWLRDALAKAWSDWLPSDTLDTIKKGGFYTTLIHKGLRVVSLNMNYCYDLNWWLLINDTDPAQQLQWFVNVLQKAEDAGEKVHVIGHVPSGSGDCLKTWSWQYYKIVNRYESTIVNQFFGHSHPDHFRVFFDLENKTRATNSMFIGPSVTTYTGLNPGFRIYTVDGDYDKSSQVVLDHETYYVNLTEANEKNKLEWLLEYSAKKSYGMSALRPSDWSDLIDRFEKDDQLFDKFYHYYHKMHVTQPCDAACKAGFLCGLKSARSHDHTFCATPPGVTYKEMQVYMKQMDQC